MFVTTVSVIIVQSLEVRQIQVYQTKFQFMWIYFVKM